MNMLEHMLGNLVQHVERERKRRPGINAGTAFSIALRKARVEQVYEALGDRTIGSVLLSREFDWPRRSTQAYLNDLLTEGRVRIVGDGKHAKWRRT